METLDCISLRRSVRKYKPDTVAWDLIGQIMIAARDAPSSGNLQNWQFIIVEDQDSRNSIAEACLRQMWMCEAPVFIVVCADVDKATQFYGIRGDKLYSIQNCAAAVQNILLAATDLGLGSCWVGAFDEEKIKDILGIPEHIRPQAVVTIGYPDERPRDPPWKHDLYTICFLESHGGRIHNVDHVLGYHSEKVVRAGNAVKKGANKSADTLKGWLDKGREYVKNRKK